MRDELMAGIERGDSDSLVLQSFVQKYGNTVLAAPRPRASIAWPGSCRSRFLRRVALTVWLVRAVEDARAGATGAASQLDPAKLDALRKKARTGD